MKWEFTDQSASVYDMTVADAAVKFRCTDQEIVDLCIAWRIKHDELDLKKVQRVKYWQDILTKAHAAMDEPPDAADEMTPHKKRIKRDGLIPAVAQEIQHTDHFAQDAGARLYRFTHGVYLPDADAHVKRRVKAILGDWKLSKEWSSHRANEVVHYLTADAPHLGPVTLELRYHLIGSISWPRKTFLHHHRRLPSGVGSN